MSTPVWKRWAIGLAMSGAALGLPPAAHAQEDLPGRVARLSLPDAAVQWAPAGTQDWQSAQANWPLTTGDRVRLPAGTRAEMHTGATALRLQGPAQLQIDALDDANLRVTLTEGSLNLAVRELAPDERIEVDTANVAMVVTRPGEIRVDTDPNGQSTAIGVRQGAATVYGETGESTSLEAPRLARYAGRQLLATDVRNVGARDALDQWAAERLSAEDQSVSARHVSRETIGYQELDAHGEWVNDASYGTVWYPRVTIADWAPYRYGQWRWVHPWGWTWIDDARWGFAPFHYGRWVQSGSRWGWVPGPISRRPAYAPALVGFAGTPEHRPAPGRAHAPGSNWFPLAPGEAWRPPFGASQRYVDRVNNGWARPGLGQPPRYQFQNRPDAISTTPRRDKQLDPMVRSTQRERAPMAMPGAPSQPTGTPPAGRDDRERRERWQHGQQQVQQNQQLQQRHEQVLREQQQRDMSARQQQLREQQDQNLRQLQRQQMEQRQRRDPTPERQAQEPQRQHERFMRERQDAQQRQLQERQQRAMPEPMANPRRQEAPAARPAMQQRPNPGEPRARPEGRERRQDRPDR
jgi:hypothetical protein